MNHTLPIRIQPGKNIVIQTSIPSEQKIGVNLQKFLKILAMNIDYSAEYFVCKLELTVYSHRFK